MVACNSRVVVSAPADTALSNLHAAIVANVTATGGPSGANLRSGRGGQCGNTVLGRKHLLLAVGRAVGGQSIGSQIISGVHLQALNQATKRAHTITISGVWAVDSGVLLRTPAYATYQDCTLNRISHLTATRHTESCDGGRVSSSHQHLQRRLPIERQKIRHGTI